MQKNFLQRSKTTLHTQRTKSSIKQMKIEISEIALIRAVYSHLLRVQFYVTHYKQSNNSFYLAKAKECLRHAKKLREFISKDVIITIPDEAENIKLDTSWPNNEKIQKS